MKFFATIAALAAVASAAPSGWQNWNAGNKGCASRDYIQYLVDQEIVYLQHLDVEAGRAAGYAIFDPNIVEFGDSINSLRYDPLGTQVEDNADTYINDTVSTPPIPQIDTLSLTIDCNQYVWQWRFYGIGGPAGPNPWINGVSIIKLNDAGLIGYQYVEFNSLAWAANIGFTIEAPTTGPFAQPPSK